MENVIPYAVVAIAMCVQKERSNLAACFVFTLFYSAQLVITHYYDGEPAYFLWAMISSPLFLIALSRLNKITICVLFLCLSEIALLLIDVIGLIAYNGDNEHIYLMRLPVEQAVIILQLSALLVRNGTSIRVHTTYGNMDMRPTQLLRRALYR